jgi:uncharacterized LabA/DUF88 family protein
VGKNVAVFVDVANIFYAAKAAGVDIDYVTLLKASSAGRDLVRAYAYTGLDPDNENQRNFHDFLRRHGYRVVSKDIRKYGDGKVKANLDIELVVDMMKTARNLDVAIVVSGDGDFAPAIRAVQEQGVRVEVVSFRGNTSSDLMDVADLFTDITQIAKVEKGSSRSGRRVATDDEDLSMTEVPDKQSEGSTERNRRGRSRRTPAAATTAATGSRSRGRAAAGIGDGALVALPGEKLSRAASAPEPEDGDLDEAIAAVAPVDGADPVDAEPTENGGPEDGPRRRRRRGGRGRGRGRGREEGLDGVAEDRVAAVGESPIDEEEAPPPARRPASAFGSVWDSQIGIAASRGAPIVDDDEDLEEPAVPEYLLTERRQRDAGRGGNRGGRGRGGAYAAALDRERFGGGRGSTPSRFSEPPPRREGAYGRPGGDQNRDRGERDRGDRQPFRQPQRPAPRPSGDEPWSEVPPEIEAILRAQIGSRPAPARPAPSAPAQEAQEATPESVPATSGPSGSARRTSTRSRRTGADASTATADGGTNGAMVTDEARPATRRTRRSTAASDAVTGEADSSAVPAPTAAKRTTTRKATTTRSRTKASASAASGEVAAETVAAPSDAAEAAAPKRRTTRRKAGPAA